MTKRLENPIRMFTQMVKISGGIFTIRADGSEQN
jgi:hypothetical protein